MIPVFQPAIGEAEVNAVLQALRRGEISGSWGESISIFEQEFAAYCQCQFGVAVSSGTAALHLAVAAAGIQPGDEVLVSASTNIATALAAYHNGAVPIAVDSEPETWNLNLDLLESLITSRTRAIIPVHLYGHPVDMDKLLNIARKHDLIVIEDCAESHGATCRGRMTGSFGEMGCFSFYANKVITTGEGGMIVTNNAALAERLRLLRNLAFSQPRFLHHLAGYNYRMTGLQAAMGIVQLRQIGNIVERKRAIAHTYQSCLREVPGLQLPSEREWARNIYWMYAVVVLPEFGARRDELMKYLSGNGIETRTFFCPMNLQPFLQKQTGHRAIACPVAENLWQSGFYLPSSYTLTEFEIHQICDTIRRACKRG